MRIWSGVIVALAAGAPAAAQQILEVDTNAGRQVAGGEEYSFDHAVVDYGRRLVLASEAADPLAVTAYSLGDGSVQHVLGGGRGDGSWSTSREQSRARSGCLRSWWRRCARR